MLLKEMLNSSRAASAVGARQPKAPRHSMVTKALAKVAIMTADKKMSVTAAVASPARAVTNRKAIVREATRASCSLWQFLHLVMLV